jgi:hypothetical protein
MNDPHTAKKLIERVEQIVVLHVFGEIGETETDETGTRRKTRGLLRVMFEFLDQIRSMFDGGRLTGALIPWLE